jgi:NAD-dependent dihydropyrimidine dehydrogenase PreA subunit
MMYLKNVVTLKYNRELCTGCRMCTIVCPHAVFKVSDGKAEITDKNLCMECGACMINCPVNAISVDKGVGCASAIIMSKLKGLDEISCDCDGPDNRKGGCCC